MITLFYTQVFLTHNETLTEMDQIFNHPRSQPEASISAEGQKTREVMVLTWPWTVSTGDMEASGLQNSSLSYSHKTSLWYYAVCFNDCVSNSKFSSILIQKVMMLLWVNGCWATATSRCFAFIYLLDGVRLVIKWRQVGFTASQLVQHPYIYHTITAATEKYRLNACTTVSLSYLVSFSLLSAQNWNFNSSCQIFT